MLLLHGSGPGVTATANWRPVIPALSQARRVIAPDQLGFGGTATGEQRTYGRAAWTGHALALPAGLDTVWRFIPGVAQMREVIGLFAHDRGLITDELIELRYQASLSPAMRGSWAAMFPGPR